MTATPSQPDTPTGGRTPCGVTVRRGSALRDALTLALLPLPLLLAAVPAAFAGGGTRRWFGGRGESQRADAQAAKDAAAAAFYELDTAQRDLRISVETIGAVDPSPAARRAQEEFVALGQRIDDVSHFYIEAVDAHDLDRDDLEASVASQARTQLTRAKDDLVRVRQELDRFQRGLAPLLDQAETQLARLAPAVERARQALLAASQALDTAREAGLRADDL
ncbi:hypothetical protein G3M53_72690, partial [Streptomyces sp. SID7982]|nr:hypothetical protein [Streptomyces sp. SID7982]